MKNTSIVDSTVSNEAAGASFASLMENWKLPETPAINSLVEGEVVATCKGGYLVSLGLKADSFMPGDQATGLVEVGGVYTFLVTSAADDEGTVNLSQKRAATWLDLKSKKESGETALARVLAVATSRGGKVAGLRANIAGVRAFIPRSELQHFGKLDELVGEEIPVKVLDLNPSKGRFGECILSQMKVVQAEQDDLLKELKAGEIVTGVVKRIIPQGVLVELGSNVTGLIRRAELSGNRSIDPSQVVRPGETVSVAVVSVDAVNRKVLLSRRSALQRDFLPTLFEGRILKGVVARSEQFGAFICLGDCIDGLLHISDFRGAEKAKAGEATEIFAVGQEIEVKIASLDLSRLRISLTRKFESPVADESAA
ncbi:MAG: 30S ribosomal protein S1 [Candidatus Melainabacteria bacterium]|nr:30S ribosomal protein S1 [Candidatus Melainabacteria bacterium]